jgi:hypothetical protein
MPNRINEIMIGPLDPLQTDCILEVKETLTNTFRIVNKYVYPTFPTRMITLAVITPATYIIKPGDLLASLCIVTTEQALEEINGNKKNLNYFLYIFYRFSVLDIFYSDSEDDEEEKKKEDEEEEKKEEKEEKDYSG